MKKKLFVQNVNRHWFVSFTLLFMAMGAFAQTGARITEVIPNTDQVTLTNFNASPLDVSPYWLCLGPGAYANVGALNGGSATIPAGGTLQLTFNVDPVADGLSLFSTNNFSSSDPDILLDFVQWGGPNQPRSGQAVTAGRWDDASDFINCPAPYATSTGGSVEAWISSIVYAPNISFDGGETSVSICVDGNADPLNVNRDPGAVGTNAGWIITDQTTGQILGLPAAPPFNLDGAGVGVCDIWYIRYEDGLSGNMVGQNIADLEGCFDLSNAIEVIREEADGGSVEIDIAATGNPNGTTSISADGLEAVICVDGRMDPLVVSHVTTAENLTFRYVVTDDSDDNIILAIMNTSSIDLDGAGIGTCRIWGWSYRGLNQDDFIGLPLADLQAEDCSDISDIAIDVIREEPDGGSVSLANGDTSVSICAGDGSPDPLSVTHTTNAANLTFRYVITDSDANNTILAFSGSSEIDLDGAGPGTCRIWGWSYRGLNQDDFVGLPLADLQAEDCSDISDDFIEVIRLTGDDCEILSIDSFENAFEFALFPNPANNNVSISFLGGQTINAQVTVYDITGRLVSQAEFSTQTEVNLDLSSLNSGTYIVQIEDNETGSNTTKQLIKR
ncbi:T9SS type A sorting domain-containing protein [Aureisphaera galaxeae]|uniref:T9SS type A sorting domain-containing protein n=1 Tax=Aureisphaera galaxeae TaxID=1538023 RepID=UPI00234FD6A9|nr:T9SS type A sorting domain-containing protein [Aureisphaera galaxeae]MDC8003193.1 T9SS type A sorting domain-containing protein [Aureisphaera galaxeae]